MRFLRRHHRVFLRQLAALALLLALAGGARANDIGDLLAVVNIERSRAGLVQLQTDPLLQQAAAAHAADLPRCGLFSHTGCDGSDLQLRLRRVAYPFALAAENLALGTPDATATLAAWLNSPGHRDNLLRPSLRDAGIALGNLNGQAFWVLVLGTRL
jgi:uncharacterized protein YkwD